MVAYTSILSLSFLCCFAFLFGDDVFLNFETKKQKKDRTHPKPKPLLFFSSLSYNKNNLLCGPHNLSIFNCLYNDHFLVSSNNNNIVNLSTFTFHPTTNSLSFFFFSSTFFHYSMPTLFSIMP